MRYYNTKEAAERALQCRKSAAIKRIEKRGDVVLGDNSHVYQNYLWKKDEVDFGMGIMPCMTQTNTLKWFTWLALVTRDMIEDLNKMKGLAEIQDMEQQLIDAINNEGF
jgi:hypothetical protein